MSLSRLQDDLLRDFREQKAILVRQIDLFDPLATSLRRPAAQRLMSKASLIIAEVFCYLAGIALLTLTVVMNQVYPFGPLENVRLVTSMNEWHALTEEEHFSIAVHGLTVLSGLLFLIMARITRRIRLKNAILDLAGRNIKELVGQHLQRKAAIEAIEQRHFVELPEVQPQEVNSVPNPGY